MNNEIADADVTRRDLGTALAALGGAIGLAALAGCAENSAASSEQTGTTAEAITGTSFKWADTIGTAASPGDLRGTTFVGTSSVHAVVAGGFWQIGDGGGGVFHWDPNSSATDDGGTIVNPVGNAGNGRWKRIYSGAVDVRWFGAKCDGVTDDTAALNAAIGALYLSPPPSGRPGGTVSIPALMALGATGWAGISVSNKDNLTLLGTSKNAGIRITVQPSQTMPFYPLICALLFTTCSRLTIQGLYFESAISGGGTGFIGMNQVTNAVVKGNHFYNSGTQSGGMTGGQVVAVEAVGGKGNAFCDNVFDHCFTALALGLGSNTPFDLREADALATGNTILDSLGDAFSLCTLRSTISDNIIDRPTLTTTPGSGLQMGGTQVTDQDLTISGNYIGKQGIGIQWDTPSNGLKYINRVSIVGNVIENCLSNAISVTGANGLVISGNTVCDNAGGIALDGFDYSLLQDISITGNAIFNSVGSASTQTTGIWVAGPANNVSISGNTIERIVSTGAAGIYFDPGGGSDGLAIGNNNIRDCYYGLFVGGHSGPLTNAAISGNTIVLNSGNVTVNGLNAIRVDATTKSLSISGNSVCARNWVTSSVGVVAIWINGSGFVAISGNSVMLDGASATSASAGIVALATSISGVTLVASGNAVQVSNPPSSAFYSGIEIGASTGPTISAQLATNVFHGFASPNGYPVFLYPNGTTYAVVSNVADGGIVAVASETFNALPNVPFSRTSGAGQSLANATTSPTAGGNTGDVVFNRSPTSGGYVGWVCLSPGTWHGFGAIV